MSICNMSNIRCYTMKEKVNLASILSKNCRLYLHNKALQYNNAFKVKNGYVYVDTVYGELGVTVESNFGSMILGFEVYLSHHIPNLIANKITDTINDNIYIFSIGKKYVKISDDLITLTLFRKLATKFLTKPVKIIECDDNPSYESQGDACIFKVCAFSYWKNLITT